MSQSGSLIYGITHIATGNQLVNSYTCTLDYTNKKYIYIYVQCIHTCRKHDMSNTASKTEKFILNKKKITERIVLFLNVIPCDWLLKFLRRNKELDLKTESVWRAPSKLNNERVSQIEPQELSSLGAVAKTKVTLL